MKRLITFLMSFIGCVCLFGQQAPMVVAGKVHISGPLYSQGAVHVYAHDAVTVDTGKIDIDNGVLSTDTVILYSNDSSDGLLRNQNVVKGTATLAANPVKVIIRKTFERDKYVAISFPFDVSTSNILGPDGNALIAYDPSDSSNPSAQFGVWEMNIKARADSSSISSDLWQDIDYNAGLQKARGYMFQSDVDRVIDFVTELPSDINELFDYNDKSAIFDVYATTENYVYPEYGNGWNQIGGLSSSSFRLDYSTVENYSGTTVWVRDKQTSQSPGTLNADFEQFLVGSAASNRDRPLELAPYVPFYVCIVPTGTGMKTGEGKFLFKSTGLILESPYYRSSREEAGPASDKLFFRLTSDKDNSFDRFYLLFSNDYSESFRSSEDALKMSTVKKNSPSFWSIQDVTNKQLFVNGLPMKDEREIKLGFSLPEKSDYTISIDAMLKENLRNVILVDNFTNKEVDLLQTPNYSFSSNAIENESGRFSIFINKSYTNISSVEASSIYASVNNNILTVKNISEGDQVKVFDLSSRLIVSGKVSGKEFSASLNQKGIYIVDVKGAKAAVLKVINK